MACRGVPYFRYVSRRRKVILCPFFRALWTTAGGLAPYDVPRRLLYGSYACAEKFVKTPSSFTM